MDTSNVSFEKSQAFGNLQRAKYYTLNHIITLFVIGIDKKKDTK